VSGPFDGALESLPLIEAIRRFGTGGAASSVLSKGARHLPRFDIKPSKAFDRFGSPVAPERSRVSKIGAKGNRIGLPLTRPIKPSDSGDDAGAFELRRAAFAAGTKQELGQLLVASGRIQNRRNARRADARDASVAAAR